MMLGKLTCALVRMFGGRHVYMRRLDSPIITYDDGVPVIGPRYPANICRRCGHTVPIKRRMKLSPVHSVFGTPGALSDIGAPVPTALRGGPKP